MKKALIPIVMLAGGLGVGAGAGFAVVTFLPQKPAGPVEKKELEKEPTSFVKATPLVVPIVTRDGHLSGYASFTVALEVPEKDSESTTVEMPLFLHEMNMRAWKTPLAAGPGLLLPDPKGFEAMAREAAKAAKLKVQRAVVLDIKPM